MQRVNRHRLILVLLVSVFVVSAAGWVALHSTITRHSADGAYIRAVLARDPIATLGALKDGADPNATLSCLNAFGLRDGVFNHTSPTGLLLAAGWRDAPRSETIFQDIPENFDVVRVIVEHGGALNATDSAGETALMIAASTHHQQTLDYLLSKGADFKVADKGGWTAWSLSYHREHYLISLIHAGQDVNQRDTNGGTAVTHAAGSDSSAILRLLLTNHADVNIRDSEGHTALWIARSGRNYMLGANESTVPDRAAKLRRNAEVIRLLERAGARL